MRLEDLERWAAARGWRLPAFQRAAWAAYQRGESGLIHAPTGTGKTLAAWGGPLLEATGAGEPIRALWITPMRALAADTRANLQALCTALGVDWTVEHRSGDTPASQRSRQRRRLPQALVTTPESASLLLSYADVIPQWRGLKAVVVDEWHELLGTKRGVQTELLLSRLRGLAPGLRVWGLSATLGNLDEARAALLGPDQAGVCIGSDEAKAIEIRTLIPEAVERFPWAGHMGLSLLPRVAEQLDAAATTLLFTNTRAQAERWFEALSMARPELAIALHHGSIEARLRAAAEEGLRSGALHCVVATSSLDLGVDFSPVEQVIQIGGPKGVARLLQRAGRAGHTPGGLSRIICVPTHALELAEFAAAREALADGVIEPRRPLRLGLDVLAQHVVTLALTGSVTAEALRDEVRQTHAYAELSATQWQWVLDFVSRGGALNAYPQFRKVVIRAEDGVLTVESATIAQRHRMSIGTITADAALRVRYLHGGDLGSVEESFIARLKPGDSFLFAGRALTLVRVQEMTALVRAGGKGQTIPRWAGGKMPLSSTLAERLVRLLGSPRTPQSPPEMQALGPLLDIQQRASTLPQPGRLLVERSRSREGEHLFVYPFAGRQVHEGLAALLAWRMSRETPVTATLTPNDYGFEILAPALPPCDAATLRRWLSPAGLESDLPASLNAAELAKRRFRDIARVAGLVFEGYPGRQSKTLKQVQMSSGLIYDVLVKYDPGNQLTAQAVQEVLDHQLDAPRLRETLHRLADSAIDWRETPRFTPFAFPLWAERIGARLSNEDWRTRVLRMAEQLERDSAGART